MKRSPPKPTSAQRNALLVDFGSTFTKVVAVDLLEERILGTARAATTVGTDILEGLSAAIELLAVQTGLREYDVRLACSSAAGGLRMAAVGLVPQLTAEAAKQAALSAGSRITGVYSYELNREDVEDLFRSRPDIVLLTGGTDGGNRTALIHNAQALASLSQPFPVVIAGNRFAGEEAAGILRASGKEVHLCANVMPRLDRLDIEPAREAIRKVFLERIVSAKGLTGASRLMDDIVTPTPAAVLDAARLLALGTEEESGLGDLLVIDIGGATTDVHSMCDGLPSRGGAIPKGLPEPYAKRTVEGDLGVRYSAGSVAGDFGINRLAIRAGIPEGVLSGVLERYESEANLLPEANPVLLRIDQALAEAATLLAVDRHAGRYERVFTPVGPQYLLHGKDLSSVRTLIGTGGPMIDAVHPRAVLSCALSGAPGSDPEALRPIRAKFLLDRRYLMAAMGLLGRIRPTLAVRLMKREFFVLAEGDALVEGDMP
jgi:uncharacterized protein (TIGR01319 family)